MGDVLGLATSGIRKTHIMYRANLSYEQVHMYLAELIERGLLAQHATDEGVVYRTTERGREFIYFYTKIVDFMDSSPQQQTEGGLEVPYLSK